MASKLLDFISVIPAFFFLFKYGYHYFSEERKKEADRNKRAMSSFVNTLKPLKLVPDDSRGNKWRAVTNIVLGIFYAFAITGTVHNFSTFKRSDFYFPVTPVHTVDSGTNFSQLSDSDKAAITDSAHIKTKKPYADR